MHSNPTKNFPKEVSTNIIPKSVPIFKVVKQTDTLIKPSFDISQQSVFNQVLYKLSFLPSAPIFAGMPNEYLGSTIPATLLDDIWECYQAEEKGGKPKSLYMSKQKEINAGMRSMLVEWIITVCLDFKLKVRTLFIIVDLIDKFCSATQMRTNKFQLLGVAAIFVACKYNEVLYPPLDEMAKLAENVYSIPEIIAMERLLLSVLEFDITFPCSIDFFELLIVKLDFTGEMRDVGELVLKIASKTYRMIKFRNSVVGASVALLVHRMFRTNELNDFNSLSNVPSIMEINICSQEVFEAIKYEVDLENSELLEQLGVEVCQRVRLFVKRQL